MASFRERLRELRNARKLSQAAAAQQMQIGSRTYQYYESGEREPQLSAVVRMADFYDVSLDYLAGRRDTP